MEKVVRDAVPGLIEALAMLAFFGLLMMPGFWLRFGVMPWEVV